MKWICQTTCTESCNHSLPGKNNKQRDPQSVGRSSPCCTIQLVVCIMECTATTWVSVFCTLENDSKMELEQERMLCTCLLWTHLCVCTTVCHPRRHVLRGMYYYQEIWKSNHKNTQHAFGVYLTSGILLVDWLETTVTNFGSSCNFTESILT